MVLIIDGNQLACRCYFSLDVLTNRAGKRTETIYGFLNSLRKIIREYITDKNSVVLLTWDGGNDRRKKIFPEYKAGRKKFENAFYEQLSELREIITGLGIKQYHEKAIEADDLIGTLTFKARKKGQKVLIISSDHDFEQLISRHVEILHPLGKNIIKNVQFVLDNYGITPDKLPEVMAITGDSTDNIPGIAGVGNKTAAKLILANGTLEKILNNVDNLKNLNKKGEIIDAKEDLKQKIKLNVNNIRISYELVKICTELDIELDLNKQKTNFDLVYEKFKILELRQFVNEFDFWKRTFGCK
jgi:DNA polymerase-1